MTGRSIPWRPVALVVIGLVGLAISDYLTTVHYAQIPLVCTGGGVIDCSAVTSSRYSVIPGTSVPITVPGMVWFAVSTCFAVFGFVAARRARVEPSWLCAAHVAWSLAGLAVVLYLIFGEISLRRICEWCTAVHLLVLASLLLAISRWQSNRAAIEHANRSVP